MRFDELLGVDLRSFGQLTAYASPFGRLSGFPNGCGRPFLAEIGFVGKGPHVYNVYLGGSFEGERLNKLYKTDIKDVDIVPLLKPIIEDYAKQRKDKERFGDYVIRKGVVAATSDGQAFHET